MSRSREDGEWTERAVLVDRRRYLELAGGVAGAGLMAGCAGAPSTGPGGGTTTAASPTTAEPAMETETATGTTASETVEADRHLWVVTGEVADRESFFPSTNVVRQGEAVALHLRNTDDEEPHDVDVSAFDVEVELDPGEETEVSFTADAPGLYDVVCELHPPWMVGQLLVLP
ncbi:MAG: cupredoxin domain-containing protein [Haloferacaceae archaeon]